MTETKVLYKMRTFKRSENTFEPLDDYAYRARYPSRNPKVNLEPYSHSVENMNRAERIAELKRRIHELEMELARELELKETDDK